MQQVPYTQEQLPRVAEQILKHYPECRIFLLEGEMGSGKTTLIKEFCRFLKVDSALSSPTFSLVNVYDSPSGKIYHLDLYRLKNLDELLDLGVEEILDSGCYVFIEWPDLSLSLIDQQHVLINIRVKEQSMRYISTLLSR